MDIELQGVRVVREYRGALPAESLRIQTADYADGRRLIAATSHDAPYEFDRYDLGCRYRIYPKQRQFQEIPIDWPTPQGELHKPRASQSMSSETSFAPSIVVRHEVLNHENRFDCRGTWWRSTATETNSLTGSHVTSVAEALYLDISNSEQFPSGLVQETNNDHYTVISTDRAHPPFIQTIGVCPKGLCVVYKLVIARHDTHLPISEVHEMEVVSISRIALPAGVFEVPQGFVHLGHGERASERSVSGFIGQRLRHLFR